MGTVDETVEHSGYEGLSQVHQKVSLGYLGEPDSGNPLILNSMASETLSEGVVVPQRWMVFKRTLVFSTVGKVFGQGPLTNIIKVIVGVSMSMVLGAL